MNSYFPYRWSPGSLTFNIYFYLFLYLYITRITINNDTPHLKSPKNQNRKAALGRPVIKLLGASTSLWSTSLWCTWLSLVLSMMVSFVLSFFPRDVLNETLDLIESVSVSERVIWVLRHISTKRVGREKAISRRICYKVIRSLCRKS